MSFKDRASLNQLVVVYLIYPKALVHGYMYKSYKTSIEMVFAYSLAHFHGWSGVLIKQESIKPTTCVKISQ